MKKYADKSAVNTVASGAMSVTIPHQPTA